ncbi:MAG: glycosyl hydrolase family 28-related protein [Candidatus Sphingomonas phytovorans]|nr:glycosyl hydrolase family 28-related protein [Sphingomonas sp.]WEJ99495.1 MAG: glycosyl hydrolase family 28-related protein [Sphingomonas sp.]
MLASPDDGDLLMVYSLDRRTLIAAAGPAILGTANAQELLSIQLIPGSPSSDSRPDVTRLLQRAFDQLPAVGGTVFLPAGAYRLSSTVSNRGKPVRLIGSGRGSTSLEIANATDDMLLFRGHEPCTISDLTIRTASNVVRTSGAYIVFDPGPGVINYSSSIERISLYDYFVGIDFRRCSDFKLRDSTLIGGSGAHAAILVANLTNADSGDSSISGSYINGGGGACILQRSSGGLRLTNLKLNGGTIGYHCNLSNTDAGTSDLLMSVISIENMTQAGVLLDRVAGDRSIFTYVNIEGVQFSNCPRAIEVIDGGTTFYDVNIRSCMIAVPIGGTGIMLNGGNTVTVSEVMFDAIGRKGNAIDIGPACVNAVVGHNAYRNFPDSPIHDRNGNVTLMQRSMSFTGSAKTNRPHGSFYLGESEVSFPGGTFLSPPHVIVGVGGDGAFGRLKSGSLTRTGCRVEIFGFVSGNPVPFTILATGI